MKTFGYVCASITLVFAFGVIGRLLWIAMIPVHAVDNTIQTAHDIIDKTVTAENAIYNYHWFKQQHEDILAIQNKITIANDSVKSFEDSAGGTRADWTFEDKTEDSRLRAVAQGLKSQYEQMVADYNAKSKEADVAIFKTV